MKYLRDLLPGDLSGKRTVVRVDYNVSLVDGNLDPAETFRIDRTISTIKHLISTGASVVLISHIGRKGESLQPVAVYLQNMLGEVFTFVPDLLGETAKEAVSKLQPGHVLLLENLRQNPGEESNADAFANALASYGDLFVQEAFAVCHREHASLIGIPKHLPSYAGFLLQDEVEHLNKALAPEAPSVLVMGGIKFETKLPLIEKLLPRYSHVLLAGGLLNTVLQRRHVKIGKSVFDEAADIDSLLLNSKLVIPERVIVLRGEAMHEIPVDEIQDEDIIVDIALDVLIRNTIGAAKTIVWNGPLGWYEKNAVSGSRALLELCNPTYQFVVAGGGDTVTLIKELNQESSVSFLSTGGGAMLEYLEYETLPGIRALG